MLAPAVKMIIAIGLVGAGVSFNYDFAAGVSGGLIIAGGAFVGSALAHL